MRIKDSKAQDKEYFLRRIDEIRISDLERLEAKARFERAEAVADVLAAAGRGIARLFTSLVKPGHTPRRPASSAR